MEEERIQQCSDICVCCGKPVPEGRMVCYACETGDITPVSAPVSVKPTRHRKGLKEIFGLTKEKPNGPRD